MAEAAYLAFVHFAVFACVMLPWVGFGEHLADIFEIGLVAVLQLLPHDEGDDQPLRGFRPMRVLAFDLDKRFAERRRVVIKIGRVADRAWRAD